MAFPFCSGERRSKRQYAGDDVTVWSRAGAAAGPAGHLVDTAPSSASAATQPT